MEKHFGIDQILREIELADEAKQRGEIPAIIFNVIEQAVVKLRATKCAYKIMLPNGKVIEHDKHKFDPPAPVKKHIKKFANGELKSHYWGYVEHMEVGDVAEIPITDKFGGITLQSAVSAQLGHEWGKGSYSTSVNKKKRVLEVLRLK